MKTQSRILKLNLELQKEVLALQTEKQAELVSTFLHEQEEKAKFLSNLPIFKKTIKNPDDISLQQQAKQKIIEIQSDYPGIGVFTNDSLRVLASLYP